LLIKTYLLLPVLYTIWFLNL